VQANSLLLWGEVAKLSQSCRKITGLRQKMCRKVVKKIQDCDKVCVAKWYKNYRIATRVVSQSSEKNTGLRQTELANGCICKALIRVWCGAGPEQLLV